MRSQCHRDTNNRRETGWRNHTKCLLYIWRCHTVLPPPPTFRCQWPWRKCGVIGASLLTHSCWRSSLWVLVTLIDSPLTRRHQQHLRRHWSGTGRASLGAKGASQQRRDDPITTNTSNRAPWRNVSANAIYKRMHWARYQLCAALCVWPVVSLPYYIVGVERRSFCLNFYRMA